MYTAVITPFSEDESIDWEAYERLVHLQIEGGVAGVVICGTTGESPTLTADERKELIRRAITLCKGKCCVIAGTGSNNTAATVSMTEWAKAAGADGCLIVNPYYNKPQQAGLIAHVRAVAAVGLPVMLYNIPGRTACKMEPSTVIEFVSLSIMHCCVCWCGVHAHYVRWLAQAVQGARRGRHQGCNWLPGSDFGGGGWMSSAHLLR